MTHPDALAMQQTGGKLPAGHAALRTDKENQAFKSAMAIMHELYTSEYNHVVVLPSVAENAQQTHCHIYIVGGASLSSQSLRITDVW
mmetsp:Transcript_97252/g.303312  ORF Transcript_97252/g.303312 Transcript_97252/m.303312 type:complete len:87 (-) Transcript_97252:241-501(-)